MGAKREGARGREEMKVISQRRGCVKLQHVTTGREQHGLCLEIDLIGIGDNVVVVVVVVVFAFIEVILLMFFSVLLFYWL